MGSSKVRLSSVVYKLNVNLSFDCYIKSYNVAKDVIRPHRSTTYADAAYCYGPSSVVCLSVGLSDTLVSRAKIMSLDSPMGRGNLGG